MPTLVTIEVTEDIASKIRFLAESGIFAIRTGNASLNFHEGTLKSIKTEIMSYPQVETSGVLTNTIVQLRGKE